MKLGIVGYAAATGIGYITRRMFKRLPVEAWLVPPHRCDFPDWRGSEDNPRLKRMRTSDDRTVAVRFLRDLDVVISIERTWPVDLFKLARRYSVKTVLLVMGEWFDPRYVDHADVLVAPTKMCRDKLQEWGCGAKTVYIPMPLDFNELSPLKPNPIAERLGFCNGWGGVDERKGARLIQAMLETDPDLLIVKSQRERDWPSKVWQSCAVDTPVELYRNIDACVQPSRWEGLGLQQLEAMACGIPVLTTDAPPMSEHCVDAHGADAHRLLCPCDVTSRVVCVKPWPDATCRLDDLMRLTKALKGSLIEDLSAQAIAYTKEYHGDAQWAQWLQLLEGLSR